MHSAERSAKLMNSMKENGRPSFLARHRGGLLKLLAVAALVIVYCSNGRFIAGSDVYPARFIPVSLVTEGDYDLNEFTFIRGAEGTGGIPGGQLFAEAGKPYDGRCLSYYPTFIPTLLAPVYFIPFRLLALPAEHFLVFYMDKLFASIFASLSAFFLFGALCVVKTPRVAAIAISLAYALGTSTWAISAQSLWQHAPSQCFLAASLWLWLHLERPRLSQSSASIPILLGLAVGCAVAARPSNVIWASLLLGDLLLRRRWKTLALYILGGLPAAIFLLAYNSSVFGDPLISGYQFNPVQRIMPDWLAWKNLPAGGLGLLFSPSLGLIPNAPFYLLLPLTVWTGLRRPLPGLSRRVVVLPALFCIGHWTLYGCYREWWAGWSFCYRYLTDILPMASFLLFNLWRVRFPSFISASGRCLARRSLWGVFAICALWGTLVQAYGSYAWGGVWFGRYWQNINQQLFVTSERSAPGTIFDKESVIWSLDPAEHLIACESEYFRWAPGIWFATPRKVHHDLFVTQTIPYGPYAPIILPMGGN